MVSFSNPADAANARPVATPSAATAVGPVRPRPASRQPTIPIPSTAVKIRAGTGSAFWLGPLAGVAMARKATNPATRTAAQPISRRFGRDRSSSWRSAKAKTTPITSNG
jgi:hypothetical protein